MSWLNKIFSVEKQPTRKIITILGLKIKVKRSVPSQLKLLFNQNEQILRALAYFLARDLFKQHYGVTIPAECYGRGSHFEFVKIKLKDIKRCWADGKAYPLDQNPPYHYLQSRDQRIYDDYIDKMRTIKYISTDEMRWSVDTFRQLEESISAQG